MKPHRVFALLLVLASMAASAQLSFDGLKEGAAKAGKAVGDATEGALDATKERLALGFNEGEAVFVLAIAQLFEDAGVDGAIVIESLQTGQRFVHNDIRSRQAFIAASTFKVFNTLIAVEEGAIGGADEPLHWDGTRYEIAEWNRDQTLRTAFQVSCVWCYQALARQVGADKYAAYLREAGYGQLREPFDASSFWLDGALTISAEEQVAFLKQVVQRSLPLSAQAYDTLRSIMLADAGPSYRLYAKTGWSTRSTPGLGWYVGYVESAGDTWLFALNLDTRDADDLPLRRQITLDALRIKGILPET